MEYSYKWIRDGMWLCSLSVTPWWSGVNGLHKVSRIKNELVTCYHSSYSRGRIVSAVSPLRCSREKCQQRERERECSPPSGREEGDERLSINVQAKLFLSCGLKAPLYFSPPFETVEILFNFIFHRVSWNNETIHCEKFLF